MYCGGSHVRGISSQDILRHFTALEKLKITYKSQLADLWNVLFLQTSDSLSLCSGLEITPGLVDLLVSVTSDENIAVCCLISGKAPPPLSSNPFDIKQSYNYTVYSGSLKYSLCADCAARHIRRSYLPQFATLFSSKVQPSTTHSGVHLSKFELQQWWNQPFRGLPIPSIVKVTLPMWI